MGCRMWHQLPPLCDLHREGGESVIRHFTAADHPSLAEVGVSHAGIADAAPPYCMVRTQLEGLYCLSTFSGNGEVLMDGKWRPLTAGTTLLAPPGVWLAFRAVKGERWGFAWVRYEPGVQWNLELPETAPVIAATPGVALRGLVEALAGRGDADGAAGALHAHVKQFAERWRTDHRLRAVWQAVLNEPTADWPLDRLAALAGCSPEHLRRLCQKHLGRSPVQQVTALRLREAARLVCTTDETFEVIAARMGCGTAWDFSRSFKRWAGFSPAEYRARARLLRIS